MKQELGVSTAGDVLPPLFNLGCPRSGTTLVSRILGSHSRIAIYHETHYYPIFRPVLRYYGNLRQSSNSRRLITDLLELVRMQEENPPGVEKFQQSMLSPTFEGILSTLLHLYARQRGKVRSGEKTPEHFTYLAEILERFPASPVIFIIRDPRDTVFSMRKSLNASIESAIQLWNKAFQSYQQASRPVHLVRYEELVHGPTEAAKTMCDFLGETYESSMLNFFEHIPASIREVAGMGRLTQQVSSGSVGNFRQMPACDIAKIEAACAYGMQVMGYPSVTSPSVANGMAPRKLSPMISLRDRLRYYGWNARRWRRGWVHWKIVLRARSHYLLTIGPLRNLG